MLAPVILVQRHGAPQPQVGPGDLATEVVADDELWLDRHADRDVEEPEERLPCGLGSRVRQVTGNPEMTYAGPAAQTDRVDLLRGGRPPEAVRGVDHRHQVEKRQVPRRAEQYFTGTVHGQPVRRDRGVVVTGEARAAQAVPT